MTEYHPIGNPPPQAGRHGDSASQVTACHRCRKQKLRCSRETPRCKRCMDISAACSYPPPPDRKLLAAQRAQNAKVRSLRESGMASDQHESPTKPFNSSEGRSPSAQDGGQSLHHSSRSEHSRDSVSEDSPPANSPPASMGLLQVSFPSKELASSLIEIYFTHLWNATLLFHKESLISDYLSGRVSDHISLSIFALGSVYLHEIAGPSAEYMPSLPGSHRPGEDWARAASQQVLMNSDQPRHETVQTCQNLAMYWYAVNETNKTNIHHCLAYRTCRLLGYHALGVHETVGDQFQAELRRRAFWASWSMACFSQSNAGFKAESWKECIGLPLPSDELSFSQRRPVAKEAFSTDGSLEPVYDKELEPSRISYLGEMMKLLSLWWEVQNFTKKCADAGPLDSLKRMSQLQELDQQMEQVRDNLKSEFQYVDQSSFASRNIKHCYQLFTIHMTYHTAICTLHSSIVPLFSNIAPDPRISKKLTRLSAEEAIKHSQKLVGMATQLLGLYPDKARCPAFSAYAMFVAVSVQFKSLGAQGLLRSDSIGHLYPAISILESVKRIWRPANLLWMTLETLFKAAGIDVHKLSDTRHLLAPPEPHTNIDHIAAHGVVVGNTDMYTYIPEEEPKSESSRVSSTSLSATGSPSPQRAVSQRKSITSRNKANKAIHGTVNTSDPIPLPMHIRNNTDRLYLHDQQPQLENIDRENMPQPHNPLVVNVLGSIPVDQQSEIMQPTSQGFQIQIPGVIYMGSNMGPDMGMNLTMGIDNMDLDASNTNLWWDQPFEDVPADQYGWWYTEGYQTQGYQVQSMNGYYQS